jgi:SAM-dependent methyltransferase
MQLDQLSRHWDHLAEVDPMWAILKDADKKGRKWSPKEFFESGRREIAAAVERARAVRPALRRRRALDFGCGLGRLTQALGVHFDNTVGVDIAPRMIQGAEEYNAHGERCSYVLNPYPDLRLFETGYFDFIYSSIVLQHIRPKYSRTYISEFVRVLAPGGVAMFQLPSHPSRTLKGLMIRVLPASVLRMYRPFDMFGLEREEVESIVTGAGAQVHAAEDNGDSGWNWISHRYIVCK